jgi:NAD(P)-dependent dehydrogenase (short-subunit alcohol dehydrogenase family)
MIDLFTFFRRHLIDTLPVQTVSFAGKTAIVTGSNVGLGQEAARYMASHGAARIILAVRNLEKGKVAAAEVQAATGCSPNILEVWKLDMSSYASVQDFAEKAKIELPRLDVLYGNAGIATTTFKVAENNEETITTNVVSLFLLGFMLHPKLRKTALEHKTQTHFTITASALYEFVKFKERNVPEGQIFATINDKTKAVMSERYALSKLLEVFIVKQMAIESPLNDSNVIVNCVCPG